jgi:hypothetical protein
MNSELIAPGVFGILFMAVFAGIAWITMLMVKKSDLVCKELVENHFNELKLLSDCTMSSGFWPDKGIIALLDDRLVFTSLMFHKSREIMFTQVMGVSQARTRGGQKGVRRLEINLGAERLKLSFNQFVFPAWKLALEKKSPMLAAASAAYPPIK